MSSVSEFTEKFTSKLAAQRSAAEDGWNMLNAKIQVYDAGLVSSPPERFSLGDETREILNRLRAQHLNGKPIPSTNDISLT